MSFYSKYSKVSILNTNPNNSLKENTYNMMKMKAKVIGVNIGSNAS